MMFSKDFNRISGINQGEGTRVLKAPPPRFTLNCKVAADVSNIKYQLNRLYNTLVQVRLFTTAAILNIMTRI